MSIPTHNVIDAWRSKFTVKLKKVKVKIKRNRIGFLTHGSLFGGQEVLRPCRVHIASGLNWWVSLNGSHSHSAMEVLSRAAKLWMKLGTPFKSGDVVASDAGLETILKKTCQGGFPVQE